MNVFKMNQMAFPGVAGGGSENTNVSALRSNRVGRAKGNGSLPLRRGVFRIPKKPSNAAIFLVSFLSYLIGIFPSMVFALPTGGTVQAGSATIDQPSAEQMIIQQTTEKAIIDWQGFGIGSTEQVDFQLSQGGVTLNRVTGNDVSQIFGKLTSNGDLWLINPNGILFGSNAQVDVHGLIATTSDISNADFLNGNYNFGIPASLSSAVVNQGRITAAEGGLVALVAPGVRNTGIISARLGKVSLASGRTFTVDLYGDQLINLGVDSQVMGQVTGMDGEVLSSLVTNSGSIFADGGVVRMDVSAAQNILDRVINMDGVIQAHSVSEQNGTIILSGGDAGEVSVTGTLDASGYGEGETGGTVHVLGEMLSFSGNGLIDVSGDLGGGTVLFGGDYQGQGSVPNSDEVYIGPNTQTFADAVTSGNGGKVIFWADRRMRFYGIVKGRGGQYFGDGGLVEVSGKEELYFDGSVDTTAANGKTGTLLLDPDTINITNGSGASASSAVTGIATISEQTLENASQFTNVILQANNSIVLNDLSDNVLNMKQGSGNSVTFRVLNGTISFANTLDTISTQGGDIIFKASGALTLGNLSSNCGDILLTGSDLTLGGSSLLNAGAGDISITEARFGTIGVGDVSGTTCGGVACGMTISNTELGQMSGNKLLINGSSENGTVYVDGVTQTTATFTGGVELKDAHISGSNGGIIFQGGASTFSTLTAKSVNGMTIDANLTTTVGALALDGDSNNVTENTPHATFNEDVTIANGVTLISAGDISLSATTGGISVVGALTLTAPSSITLTGNLTATGDVALTASNGITLNGDITTSSGGNLNINANSSTLSLASGAALNSASTLTLAAGNISSLGAMTLTSTGATSINSSLNSAGAVTMTANGLTLNNSTLTAAGNINLEGGSSGLTLVSGMGITSSAGNIILAASGGSITANGAFTLTSNGTIEVNNALTSAPAGTATLNANSGITLNGFSTNGAVNINADTDSNSVGIFTISSGTLSTTSNALTVTTSDLSLVGLISASAATINVSNSGALGLGSPSAFSGMDISTAELGQITGDLNLISGNITVGLGAVSVSGILTLGQTNGTITGQGAMTLSAANGLVINSKTISSTGNLILNNGAGTDASLSLASGAVLTANGGSITLNATTSGTSAAGAVTFNADSGITINDNFTAAGATAFDADSNNDSTGTFTTATGKALSTTNNTLAITAGDLILAGTLSSGNAGTTILASTGGTIGLGTTAGTMSLDDAELGNITANSLTIGDATSGGAINVDGVTSLNSDQFGTLTLSSGAAVTFGATTASTFGQGLTVNAAEGINIASGLTTNGTTSFNADTDDLNTGDFTLTSGNVSAGNNSLLINSNGMTLGGTLSSGTASTTIQASRADTTIGLGTGAGTFSLTTAKLNQITAGSLIVGDNTNGTITVGGLTTISTPLTLNATKAGSAVNFDTGLSSGLGDLTINAGTGGVGFVVDVSTTGNMNVISGGAITDTGALTVGGTSSFTTNVANQAITLDNTSNVFTGAVSMNTTGSSGNATLVSSNAVTLSTSTVGGNLDVTVGNSLNVTGAGSAGGSIILLADDDIIFTTAGDLTATTGITVTADADSSANGSGGALTMVDGTVFNAGTGTLALSADEDITLGLVRTANSSDTAVTLTSTSGGLVDGDTVLPPTTTQGSGANGADAWLDVDAANGRLVAKFATGFGSTNAIETRVKSVDIENSTSGGIDIFEFDDLDIFKINNAGGGVQVSFEGEITGKTNCTGACLFLRRDIRNELIEGTGKTLGQLTDSSVNQLSFGIFELKGPDFLEKTPADRVAGSPNGPFTADLFSEKFELVELAAGTDGKFDSMEVSQSFWGGSKQPTLEVAEWKTPNKKTRSRQRSAKRKKRVREKVDDTAAITLKKPRRIQMNESGYLGLTPPTENSAGRL